MSKVVLLCYIAVVLLLMGTCIDGLVRLGWLPLLVHPVGIAIVLLWVYLTVVPVLLRIASWLHREGDA